MSRRAASFNSAYWEQGFAIDANALRAFSEALGVTMDYLYTGRDSWANTPGKRIRQRRDELGWSAHELADKSVSLDWVLSLEADADECVRCDKIAEALGVTPEWISTGAEPKFPPPKAPACPLYFSFSSEVEYPKDKNEDIRKLYIAIECLPDDVYRVVEAIRTGRAVECA